MVLRNKAQMIIPLCWMISMSIVRPALKFKVFKMEQAFQTRYQDGDKVFYVSPLNWKGQEEFQKQHMFSWSRHWMFENERFESSCLLILTWSLSLGACFLCGMGIIGCKLGCLTLIIYMMMGLFGTSLLIKLSLTPFMGLLNFSLPWWNSTSMLLNLFFLLTLS